MKPMKSILVLAIILTPALAAAQGYYGRGGGGYVATEPGGFHHRANRLTFGFSVGLGGMHDSGGSIQCDNCSSVAGHVEGHIGAMLSSRLALQFELQANMQTLHSGYYDDTTLVQSVAMVAAQYWLTPQLWIKGGVGAAHLSLDSQYYGDSSEIDNGLGLMGGVGYELLSARRFSIDLQGRIITGSYHGIDDQVTSGTIGVGVNWF
jgi:outer membrane protein with beta-barrel domain